MPSIMDGNGMNIEIDCKKLEWQPSRMQEVIDFISTLMCQKFEKEDLHIRGCDRARYDKWKLDCDVSSFFTKETPGDNKTIKVKLPEFATPLPFKPRQGKKILCKGKWLEKYFTEEKVSTRKVSMTLKLYPDNRFYFKNSLTDGGTPYLAFFEGSYTRKGQSLTLHHCLKYTWQEGIRERPTLEAVNKFTKLGFGDRDVTLAGQVPTIVGTDPFCFAEFCREPNKIINSATRWNPESGDEDEEEKKEAEKKEEEKEEAKPKKKPVEVRRPPKPDAAKEATAAKPTDQAAARPPRDHDGFWEPEEERWPFFLGIFLMICLIGLIIYAVVTGEEEEVIRIADGSVEL
mmetsp:Transcript_8194/g.17786  ORF Transcript_8194/g.17786 Transcript_8194/m.17786 type:complete len:345 (+) Transcript_8194:54-1088(+)